MPKGKTRYLKKLSNKWKMGCVILLTHSDTLFTSLCFIHLIFCSFIAAVCYCFLEATVKFKQAKVFSVAQLVLFL